eukprot:scaffold308673_cov30-Tisochrysis_lutea.AAC.1
MRRPLRCKSRRYLHCSSSTHDPHAMGEVPREAAQSQLDGQRLVDGEGVVPVLKFCHKALHPFSERDHARRITRSLTLINRNRGLHEHRPLHVHRRQWRLPQLRARRRQILHFAERPVGSGTRRRPAGLLQLLQPPLALAPPLRPPHVLGCTTVEARAALVWADERILHVRHRHARSLTHVPANTLVAPAARPVGTELGRHAAVRLAPTKRPPSLSAARSGRQDGDSSKNSLSF